MNSLFIACLCVVFVSEQLLITYAETSSEIFFEKRNKCGCFRHDQCPQEAKCTFFDHVNYEDLQNSTSLKTTDICNKWFLEGFTKNLVISENGTLNITLHFSSDLKNTVIFEVQLRYQSQCNNIGPNIFHLLDSVHSREYVIVQGNFNNSCKKMIDISFPYVFSGCYQLYINKKRNPGGCISKPFNLTSSYKKSPLSEFKVDRDARYKSQSQALIFTYKGEGLRESKSIHFKLFTCKDGQLVNMVKEAHLTSVHRGNCCHAIHKNSSHRMTMPECPCKWNSDDLICKFHGLKNGSYGGVIEFIDPRCEKSTLWTQSKTCNFGICKEAVEHFTPKYGVTSEVADFHLPFIMCLLLFFIAGGLFIWKVLYDKKGGKKYILFGKNITIMKKSHYTNERKSNILLLYPRDCDEFMRTMMQFRILLKDSCSCEVYDPWDEDISETVAQSIETWSLHLINDKFVKIIVVLSKCSKIIEESLIYDKYFFTYREPKAFDKVFVQSLKVLSEYFATRSDSYQRLFVVRFDEIPVIDLSFNFNPCIIYTLPHSLQSLLNDLQNGTTSVCLENKMQWKAALEEYLIFKQQHPDYLNDIIKVDVNSKISRNIKN